MAEAAGTGPRPGGGVDPGPPPLDLRLRDELAARIAAREWLPGTPLPSGRKLAAAYRVSLCTIHHALEQLAQDGLVRCRQGSGTFVRQAVDVSIGAPTRN